MGVDHHKCSWCNEILHCDYVGFYGLYDDAEKRLDGDDIPFCDECVSGFEKEGTLKRTEINDETVLKLSKDVKYKKASSLTFVPKKTTPTEKKEKKGGLTELHQEILEMSKTLEALTGQIDSILKTK